MKLKNVKVIMRFTKPSLVFDIGIKRGTAFHCCRLYQKLLLEIVVLYYIWFSFVWEEMTIELFNLCGYSISPEQVMIERLC